MAGAYGSWWDSETDIEVVVEEQVLRAHSATLAGASPVFAAMLRSEMKEGSTRRIRLEGKSRTEFLTFLSFLQPGSSRQAQIDDKNIDFLLAWFHEYQVEPLLRECEEFLLGKPVSVDRLIQAKVYGFHRQYRRCLEEVASKFHVVHVELLLDHTEIMRDCIPLMKKAMKESVQETCFWLQRP
eukprot:CAMPEP_0197907044 /NCGR_PEP_ID=MMETSP1439-20131203/63932_1 /TAXON_ID=66791 /ORGANISM="Gonyaulax spinifera, Strain CCMP409" /LENGTH=182 /DNA_ID=CAMNT_0043528447 /DNA_START=51 /DNA_END=602 /DNA_ORIENTATION=+